MERSRRIADPREQVGVVRVEHADRRRRVGSSRIDLAQHHDEVAAAERLREQSQGVAVERVRESSVKSSGSCDMSQGIPRGRGTGTSKPARGVRAAGSRSPVCID